MQSLSTITQSKFRSPVIDQHLDKTSGALFFVVKMESVLYSDLYADFILTSRSLGKACLLQLYIHKADTSYVSRHIYKSM